MPFLPDRFGKKEDELVRMEDGVKHTLGSQCITQPQVPAHTVLMRIA